MTKHRKSNLDEKKNCREHSLSFFTGKIKETKIFQTEKFLKIILS